jgi:hypothetical protein
VQRRVKVTTMILLPRVLRPTMPVTYSVSDLVVVSLTAAVVAIWAAVAGGSFSPLVLLACEAVFFAFYLVGSLFAGWQPLAAGILFDLPLRLLVGYAVVNTALLALAWLSPLDIIANFAVLLAIVALLLVATPFQKQNRGDFASLWVVGICLAATSLWCQDSIHPTSEQGNIVLVKPWVDGFYHAIHIRIFGASHGASSIEDFRLAGVPARLYHYGVYLTPALVKQASGIHSYPAFAGILAPLGVFFTGLAAYAFFGSLLGAWPGLAAAAALLLLPDGAQQGMQNNFMSYHWLTQISPSATYGLALLAVAWLFVIRGCMQGSRLQVFAGWLVSGILVFYKLHFFIASALLLLLVPPLFFRGSLGPRKRGLWAVSATVAYVVTLAYGQKVPGVPLIRFDGSSVGEVLRLVKAFASPGILRDHLDRHVGPDIPTGSNLLCGIPYILLTALGIFAPLLVILVIRLRRRVTPLFALFPLLLIANFLTMFFGLALDFGRSTPDELSQRPVMIVYFFVVAWVGGALGLSLLESRRLGQLARPALICVAIVLMGVPAFFGAGVQKMWAMPRISPVRIPIALLRVTEYIRDHGSAKDVIQDSQFDRTYVVAALSERMPFAARTMTRMPYHSEMVEQRASAIEHFMGIRQPKLVTATARTLGFRWFLLEPGDRVDWPAEITNHPAFQMGPFRLYQF